MVEIVKSPIKYIGLIEGLSMVIFIPDFKQNNLVAEVIKWTEISQNESRMLLD